MSHVSVYQPWIVDVSYLHGDELIEAQRKNRQYAMEKMLEARDAKIAKLQVQIDELHDSYQFTSGCDYCCGLPTGPQDLKFDCDRLYGLRYEDDPNNHDDSAWCPKCNRCLVQWGG